MPPHRHIFPTRRRLRQQWWAMLKVVQLWFTACDGLMRNLSAIYIRCQLLAQPGIIYQRLANIANTAHTKTLNLKQ